MKDFYMDQVILQYIYYFIAGKFSSGLLFDCGKCPVNSISVI